MFFVISPTLLINVNNVMINLTPGLEWIIPSLEITSVQLGMVVQDGRDCAAWVCCSVLIKISD